MFSDYFAGIMSLCAFASVVISVTHASFRSAMGFGVGAIVICAIMLPLVDIIRDFDIEKQFDDILGDIEYDGSTDSAIELGFERGLEEYVAQMYGVDVECVKVMVDGFDMEKMQAERIYVTLSSGALHIDYKRLEEELSKKFASGGECEVSLDIG